MEHAYPGCHTQTLRAFFVQNSRLVTEGKQKMRIETQDIATVGGFFLAISVTALLIAGIWPEETRLVLFGTYLIVQDVLF